MLACRSYNKYTSDCTLAILLDTVGILCYVVSGMRGVRAFNGTVEWGYGTLRSRDRIPFDNNPMGTHTEHWNTWNTCHILMDQISKDPAPMPPQYVDYTFILGIYSLSRWTSYRRISQSLEAAGFGWIALKFDRHLDSRAAEMPVKFQSHTNIITSDLVATRFHEILP